MELPIPLTPTIFVILRYTLYIRVSKRKSIDEEKEEFVKLITRVEWKNHNVFGKRNMEFKVNFVTKGVETSDFHWLVHLVLISRDKKEKFHGWYKKNESEDGIPSLCFRS